MMKRLILSLWLLKRLAGCRKILRQAYFFPDFSDSDIELLDVWFAQSKALQIDIFRLLLNFQMRPAFLVQSDAFCQLIEVDLLKATQAS